VTGVEVGGKHGHEGRHRGQKGAGWELLTVTKEPGKGGPSPQRKELGKPPTKTQKSTSTATGPAAKNGQLEGPGEGKNRGGACTDWGETFRNKKKVLKRKEKKTEVYQTGHRQE